MSDAALATVTRIPSLLLEGQLMNSEISHVLRDALIERTIEGASTLTIDVYDDSRTLLKSGIFSERTRVRVDQYTFELVQIRKSGSDLSLVFEDLPVAALRRRTTPLKVSPNTLTHVEFAERLVLEEEWLSFWTPPELRSGELSRVELTRGKPDAMGEEPEDSWTALGRIAEERGWRRYVLNKEAIAYVPETYLLDQPPVYTLREGGVGTADIDFDFDTGKPVATLRVRVRSGRWNVPVGAVVRVEDLGPANGNWLVSATSRSIFSLFIDVTLTKARPVLPEPEAAAVEAAVSAGGGAVTAVPSAPSFASADDGTYPSDPSNLVKIGQGNHRLIPSAAASFMRVQAKAGIPIPITDSYRSTASQAASYRSNPYRFAKPGGSAHGEGRAVDVDLKRCGVGNQSPDPTKWDQDPVWKRLNEAFMDEGWCNYQYRNQSTKGKTSEPWHWSYKVCK